MTVLFSVSIQTKSFKKWLKKLKNIVASIGVEVRLVMGGRDVGSGISLSNVRIRTLTRLVELG